MNRTLPLLLTALFLAPTVLTPIATASPGDFPRPASLEADVAFWERIYSEVGTSGGLIHDTRDLRIVYETVQLPKGLSGRARGRHTDRIKARYKKILKTLAGGKRTGLSPEEARVLALFGSSVSNRTLRDASRQVRFQLGQADKFRAGIIRSGAYKPHILKTLRGMALPLEIANLPHVESSYTPTVYSRVGAAGLWQFTRSTGRRFMRVDHVVDERLDPYRASVAAARLLEQNYRVTGSWPLAITAYNHGASGMRRAARKLGTKDITTIVRKYKSRTFGFASRNFYVEFLAANAVASNATRHFGPLTLNSTIDFESTKMPFFAKSSDLARAIGVDHDTLRQANPGLRPTVWKGSKRIPKGFEIKVPRDSLPRPLTTAISSMSSGQRYARQTRDASYTVRRGDTLSKIARRHGVKMSQLVALNRLKSRHSIRVGQKLRLPAGKGQTSSASARSQKTPDTVMAVQKLPDDGTYRVRRGDNLSKIAKRFGMSVSELASLNSLRSKNRIKAGQKLRVRAAPPAAIAASTPRTAPKTPPPTPTPSKPKAKPMPKEVFKPAVTQAPKPPAAAATTQELASINPDAVAEEIPEAASPSASTLADHDESAIEPSPGLLADPSDYTVSSKNKIIVQANETLGHYADWLGIRASRLRKINGLRYGQHVVVQRKLKLDFSVVNIETFERIRVDYHRALQEDFFAEWEIEDTVVHKVGAGDSLWQLSTKRYKVPIWLLRQYNPDTNLDGLSPGTKLTIPKLKAREEVSDRRAHGSQT